MTTRTKALKRGLYEETRKIRPDEFLNQPITPSTVTSAKSRKGTASCRSTESSEIPEDEAGSMVLDHAGSPRERLLEDWYADGIHQMAPGVITPEGVSDAHPVDDCSGSCFQGLRLSSSYEGRGANGTPHRNLKHPLEQVSDVLVFKGSECCTPPRGIPSNQGASTCFLPAFPSESYHHMDIGESATFGSLASPLHSAARERNNELPMPNGQRLVSSNRSTAARAPLRAELSSLSPARRGTFRPTDGESMVREMRTPSPSRRSTSRPADGDAPVVRELRTPSPPRRRTVRHADGDETSSTPVARSPAAPLRRRRRVTLAKAILTSNKKMVREVCGCPETLNESAVGNSLHNDDVDDDPNCRIHIREFASQIPARGLDLIGAGTDGCIGDHRVWILPLLAAATISTPGVVQALLDVGAVVNGVNEDGRNSLHVMSLGQFGPGDCDTNMQEEVLTVSRKGDTSDRKLITAVGIDPQGDTSCVSRALENSATEPNRNGRLRRRSRRSPRVSSPLTARMRLPEPTVNSNTFPTTRVEAYHPDQVGAAFRQKELALSAYILIRNGIDFRLRDLFGHTPATYARMNGHTDVLQVIGEAEDRLRRARYDCLIQHSPLLKRRRCSNVTVDTSCLLTLDGSKRNLATPIVDDTNREKKSSINRRYPRDDPLKIPVVESNSIEPYSNDNNISTPKTPAVSPTLQKFAVDFVIAQQQSLMRSPFTGSLTASFIGTPGRYNESSNTTRHSEMVAP